MPEGKCSKTADDYETLRNYATNGAETREGAEVELAVFIAHGAAAWIRSRGQGRNQEMVQRDRSVQRGIGDQGHLVILLANMIESKGVS